MFTLSSRRWILFYSSMRPLSRASEIGTRVFLHSDFQEKWTTSGLINWSQGRGLWYSPAQDNSWKRKTCSHKFLLYKYLTAACHLTEENLLAFSFFFFRLLTCHLLEWFTPAIPCLGILALSKNHKSLKHNWAFVSQQSLLAAHFTHYISRIY